MPRLEWGAYNRVRPQWREEASGKVGVEEGITPVTVITTVPLTVFFGVLRVPCATCKSLGRRGSEWLAAKDTGHLEESVGLWLHLRSLEKRGPLQSGEPRAQSGVSSVAAPGSGLELPRSGGREVVVARRLRGVSREVGQPVGRGTSAWDKCIQAALRPPQTPERLPPILGP